MMPVSCGRGGTDLTRARVVLRRTVGITIALAVVSTYFARVDKGVLYNLLYFHARLIHRPEDEGSTKL
jgi:hypothetical protein